MRHLTDEQIQQLAEDGRRTQSIHWEHIDFCPVCRQTLDDYLILATALGDDDPMPSGFTLADSVMAKIEGRRQSAPARDSKLLWWTGIAAVVTGCGILAGLQPEFINSAVGTASQFLGASNHHLARTLGSLPSGAGTLGASLAILAGIWVTDRVIQKVRRHSSMSMLA